MASRSSTPMTHAWLRFAGVHPGRSVTFGFSERAQVRAEAMETSPAGVRFRALGVDYETGMTGRHAVSNLLAAIAVAQVFDIAPERLREAGAHLHGGQDARRAPGTQRHYRLERLL